MLCIETEPIKIKTGKNNLLQPYLSSRHLLDDQNILNDTKNRAETTYLNIFLSLKSGSFWVRAHRDEPIDRWGEMAVRRKNHLTHPQAELVLSHMWPVRGSNLHQPRGPPRYIFNIE